MSIESSPVTSWSEEIKRPQIHPTAYIHHSAVIIGDVRIDKNVFICTGVILRADEGSPIIIKEGSNVQDGVIMHCLKGSSIEIGSRCSIAHGAVVHGPCVIGGETFIGFNAVVHDARLGQGCYVSHCALVTNVDLPDLTMVPAGKMLQSQAEVIHLPMSGEGEKSFSNKVLSVNDELRRGYKNLNHLEIQKHESQHETQHDYQHDYIHDYHNEHRARPRRLSREEMENIG